MMSVVASTVAAIAVFVNLIFAVVNLQQAISGYNLPLSLVVGLFNLSMAVCVTLVALMEWGSE